MSLFQIDRRPPHDSATCSRPVCGRCRPSEAPSSPPPVDHAVAPHKPRSIAKGLAQRLHNAGDLWGEHGDEMALRADVWRTANLPGPDDGGDEEQDEARRDARSDHDRMNAAEAAQAATYYDELDRITKRLDADLRRLERLKEIICPVPLKRSVPASVQAAEAAGEGWCASCFRDRGWLEPQHEGRYRGLCRFCGEWKAANGEVPPQSVVAWRHRNPHRRLTEQVVAQMTRRGA